MEIFDRLDRPILDLFPAFLKHLGEDLSTGHYVAYILKDGMWYYCSDSTVKAGIDELPEACLNGYVYYYKRTELVFYDVLDVD